MKYKVLKKFESTRFGSCKVDDEISFLSDSVALNLINSGHIEKAKEVASKKAAPKKNKKTDA